MNYIRQIVYDIFKIEAVIESAHLLVSDPRNDLSIIDLDRLVIQYQYPAIFTKQFIEKLDSPSAFNLGEQENRYPILSYIFHYSYTQSIILGEVIEFKFFDIVGNIMIGQTSTELEQQRDNLIFQVLKSTSSKLKTL